MRRLNVDTLSQELMSGTPDTLEREGVRLEYTQHRFEGFSVNILDYHLKQDMEFISEIPYKGCDLLFTLEGQSLLRSDTQNIQYTAKELVISNGQHSRASLYAGAGVMRCFSIKLSEEFLNSFCKNSFDLNQNIILKKAKIDPLSWLFIEQILHADRSDPLSQIYIQSRALDIIYTHFKGVKSPLAPADGVMLDEFDRGALLKAREILSAEFKNPPSLTHLARRVRLNEFKLKLGFKRLFSQTPYEFLRAQRMRIALDLVRNSEMSLAQISTHIGLKSQSHFSRMFHQYHGFPPKDLMKRRSCYF